MKLARIDVRNYRSIAHDNDGRGPFSLELGSGVNAIIGPNNVGKSNILRALAFALDPDFVFDRKLDSPEWLTWAKPTVTLTFEVPEAGRTSSEKTLLRYLDEYERAVNPRLTTTSASRGVIKLRVRIESKVGSTEGVRHESFVVSGVGARKLSSQDDLAQKAFAKFRECFHFVLIRSGESLESLMEGRFRDILGSVLRRHMADSYDAALGHRTAYVDALRSVLLRPLTERIGAELHDLFPEIRGVTLSPDVRSLDETLEYMRIDVADRAVTDLADKGTGVRGGLIIAMLRHLATSGNRSFLFAVEEPESFLHPAAQETLRTDLDELAANSRVSLLITTHSPHVVSRTADSRAFSVAKSAEGATILRSTSVGSDGLARALVDLYPDPTYAHWLDRTARLSQGCRLILVVEGFTDRRYIEIAAEVAGAQELLEDIRIVLAGDGFVGGIGGATMAMNQASTLRSVTPTSVAVLLDNDEPGREAAATLARIRNKTGDWVEQKTLFSYRHAFRDAPRTFGYEAEDLWPDELYEKFFAELPPKDPNGRDWYTAKVSRPRPEGGWHHDLTDRAKERFIPFLEDHASAKDAVKWIELLHKIRTGAGLDPLPKKVR